MGWIERPNKYRNVPVTIDGVRFASKREANRYCELKLLLRAGAIRDLVTHPKYPLCVLGVTVATYVADFAYLDVRTGGRVTEDAKGVRTPVYRLKKRLMKAIHGIDVKEV